MISHHLGISILPQLVIQNLPPTLRAIPLKQGGYRTIGIAMKHHASPVTKKFAEILSAWLKRTKQLPKIVAIEAYPYITLK